MESAAESLSPRRKGCVAGTVGNLRSWVGVFEEKPKDLLRIKRQERKSK